MRKNSGSHNGVCTYIGAILSGFHHHVYLPAIDRKGCFGCGVLNRLFLCFQFHYVNRLGRFVPCSTIATSMYFWSVSWLTNCLVYFSFFWSTIKNCPVSETRQKKIGQSLNFFFFWSVSLLEGEQKNHRLTKKNRD